MLFLLQLAAVLIIGSHSTCYRLLQIPCQGPAVPFNLSLWSGGHPGITAPPPGCPVQLIPQAFEIADIKAFQNWKMHLQSARLFVAQQWPFMSMETFRAHSITCQTSKPSLIGKWQDAGWLSTFMNTTSANRNTLDELGDEGETLCLLQQTCTNM